ncbi:MAG TPA: hypothetical protein DCY64_19935 [Hydrogenophaga sp.]|uniref:hypothetical protein n=1 Tax=Hydrogenophaga sp. TaxID=1904254 RepID=UPI0008B4A4E5|nr:hypothetical protein [Hydrogenophaga sp.]OGA78454.1 MAG: hypothetical protein A2X73_08675 [Burkholderiales bacterium GWE1_65_30]OGA92504.1 MAG: hypothetical protein A2X72_18565 [Burkholderiales bacterium GWF1_66_17]HAX22540.1 hypothetical protein [Hydrogenophaga sp.]HBU18083.1 hypothetical protein [Hydrogenophaga sp.]
MTAATLTDAKPGWAPARMGVFALLVLAALWLGWKAWDVNITMSCWKDEWPNLPVCEEINGRTPPERVARLQERLAANPGDSPALVELTELAHRPETAAGLDAPALLAAAGQAAPQDVTVLQLQANEALRAQRWPDALDKLTRLSQHHHNADATRVLAELVALAAQPPAQPTLQQALVDAVGADAGWLDRVLRAMPGAKLPLGSAMPLVALASAKEPGLSAPLGLYVIRQLKTEGLWLEAHAIWLRLWKRPLGYLFNGDFEQNFVAGGFDWEVIERDPHRGGARIDLAGRRERGQVLRVAFTGRAMKTPLVRQHLLLPPGSYRFAGEFQSGDLRSERGLAWVFSCASDGRELARTTPLMAGGRTWQPLAVSLEVPAECGLGVALALQTEAPFEAKTGLRGEVVFDRFTLVQAPANQGTSQP